MKKQIFLFALLVSTAAFVQAQDEDRYNPVLTSVPSLTITPDAIGGGMGDIGVSTKPNLNSQFWNSSKYALAESQGGFSISYTPWLRKIVNDIDLAYLSGYYQISDVAGTLSASLKYFSLGEVTLRQSADQIVVETVKPYEMAFDLGYSRKLAEHFSMGVNLRFVLSDLKVKSEEYHSAPAFSADINGFYSLPIEISSGESQFNLGFNLSNIGTKISYDDFNKNFMPTNFRLGASYYLPFDKYNRLGFSLEANKLLVPTRTSKYAEKFDANDPYNPDNRMTDEEWNDISVIKALGMSFADAPGGFKEEMQEIMWSAGLEYSYNEQFFVRAGYCNENEWKGNRKFFTLGAGFKWTAFRIDVGYVISAVSQSALDNVLRFTLAFDVDGLKELTDRR
ncbi:MAG: type IX secretion system outer membrane channel protein PorV [Prevotellaceae bacterium]|jgi:hypothetical protein|nr:type IX secretion system outer membrane channel protein PorV [Prevotellaceae bacterium]